MKNLYIHGIAALISLVLLGSAGCKPSFTFTGAKIPSDVKTISIEQFENNAPIVVSTLAQDFTEKVRDFFTSRTNLQLVESNGDLNLSGAIVNYDVAPINLTGGDVAATNRLTIRINAEMTSENHPDLAWKDSFSNFADFDAATDISTIENDLITEVNNKIAQDLFNKTFANW
ncbi:MAG: LptE family protein [Bacteroidia bacterium]|nr:LptE family protein [Bacteroidia bacterium]